jgi:hypothetical protein
VLTSRAPARHIAAHVTGASGAINACARCGHPMGWIHLLIGLGQVASGIFLLRGQGLALMAGIVIAGISAAVNFS